MRASVTVQLQIQGRHWQSQPVAALAALRLCMRPQHWQAAAASVRAGQGPGRGATDPNHWHHDDHHASGFTKLNPGQGPAANAGLQ